MQSLQIQLSYKAILKIALPISFAILIPQLNFFINTTFLAQLGEHELGEAGITGVYYLIFSSIGYGLNNGLQSLISKQAGANNPSEIGKLFNQGVLLAMLLAALGIVITYTVLPTIIYQVIHNSTTAKESLQFLQIRIWGLPFLYVYQMRNALLVGINQSKYLPYGTAAETGVNILLDYALIFGHFGLPAMGFNGAAYASIIAEIVGMVVTFGIIHYKGIAKQFTLFAALVLDKVRVRQIWQQSGPLMFQHAISIVSWFVFFLLIGGMVASEMNLAISNTMRNIFGLFGVVVWALGGTTNTVVSNLIGQGKLSQVPKAIRMLCTISIVFMVGSVIVLNVFPTALCSLFKSNANTILNTIPVIRVVSIAMLIMSAAVVYINALIALGKSKIAFYIEAAVITLYLVYIYVVIAYAQLSLPVAWMSEWLYWVSLLIGAVYFVHNTLKSSNSKAIAEV